MPTSLILHPGLHKTGTTSFQKLLNQGRDALLEQGVLYPKTGLWRDQHAFIPRAVIDFHKFVPEHPLLDTPEKLVNQLHRELNDSDSRYCIISSEVFCEIEEKNKLILPQIFELFDRSEVFLTLRNPQYAALSGIKHQARENAKNERNFRQIAYSGINKYHAIVKDIAKKYKFWKNLPIQNTYYFREVSLDDRRECSLMQHYLNCLPVDLRNVAFETTLLELQANAAPKYYTNSMYFVFFILGFLVGKTIDKNFNLKMVKDFMNHHYELQAENEFIENKDIISCFNHIVNSGHHLVHSNDYTFIKEYFDNKGIAVTGTIKTISALRETLSDVPFSGHNL